MKFIIALAIHAILFVGYLKAECLANEWEDATGNCLPCHYSWYYLNFKKIVYEKALPAQVPLQIIAYHAQQIK